MVNISEKIAIKTFEQYRGPLNVRLAAPIRKESDLSFLYYPGIQSVRERMERDPKWEMKWNPLYRSVALISTGGPSVYPILAAKAGIISELTKVNAFPILLRYENPTNLPALKRALERSFALMIWCHLKPLEREILDQSVEQTGLTPWYDSDFLSGAAVASVLNAARYFHKQLKKLSITIDSGNPDLVFVVRKLVSLGAQNITLVDDRGELYVRRPNMNQTKIVLASMLQSRKTGKSREEIFRNTDVYVTAQKGILPSSVTNLLADRCVIISLRATEIQKKPRQTLVSTLPQSGNHITDLHLVTGVIEALQLGKKPSETTLLSAIKGLSEVYSKPSLSRFMPGLLEKNLGKKIARGIR